MAARNEDLGGSPLDVAEASRTDDARRRTASRDRVPERVALPLVATLLILGLAYWCVDIVSPALPAIRASLDLSATGAGLVMSAFFGGRLLSNLPAALLVDRRGPRTTAAVGAAILVAGSVLAALAETELMLLPARASQGAGVALLATAGLLSVLRALPGGGAAMTAFNVSAGIGGSFGLYASGILTDAAGWQAIFWFSALLGLVMLVAALVARPGAARNPRPRSATDEALTQTQRWPLALIGALVANLLVYGNYAIWVVALPLYASTRFAASPAEIGLVLLIVNAVHLLGAIPAGRVIHLRGAMVALAIGLVLAAAGMAAMIVVPDPRWLVLAMALYALGQVAGNSASGDLLLRLGGGGGRAVGMVRLTSDLGLVVGPAAAGALADGFGVAAPFAVLAICSASGGFVALVAVMRQIRGATAIG